MNLRICGVNLLFGESTVFNVSHLDVGEGEDDNFDDEGMSECN